jgi:hypothetical protein
MVPTHAAAMRLMKATVLTEPPSVNTLAAPLNMVFAVQDAMEMAYPDFALLRDVCQQQEERLGGSEGDFSAMLRMQEQVVMDIIPVEQHGEIQEAFRIVRTALHHIPMYVLTSIANYAHNNENERQLYIEMFQQPDLRVAAVAQWSLLPERLRDFGQRLMDAQGDPAQIVLAEISPESRILGEEFMALSGMDALLDALTDTMDFSVPGMRAAMQNMVLSLVVESSAEVDMSRLRTFLQREDIRNFNELLPDKIQAMQRDLGSVLQTAIDAALVRSMTPNSGTCAHG